MPVLIQIHAVDFQSTEAINDHINKTVAHAMEKNERQVTRVEVHLHDSNAKKGGVDKRCVMEARLAGHQPLAVEAIHADMYLAITDAAGKLQRAVSHKLDRHESHRSGH